MDLVRVEVYTEELEKWMDCDGCKDKKYLMSITPCEHCKKNCIFVIPQEGPIWAILSIVNKRGYPIMHSCKEGQRKDREETGYDFQYIMSYLAHNPTTHEIPISLY